ncbi:MAG: hypothetical protein HKL85_10035 [Acidimicrobiaceae bacterium]|nr:hypothetical protein [Acidimicrobiaceae bacterium]
MSFSLRRFVALGALGATAISSLLVTTDASAATTTAPQGIVASILGNTNGYLTSVRTYFLCNTAKCKTQRSALLKSAQGAMTKLSAQAVMASGASVQQKYRSAVDLFVSDVHLLAKSYNVFFTTTSTVTLSGEVGNIFYLTSDIGTDVNMLSAAEKSATATFNLWVEGEAATLVAMQTDASALQSSTATASIGIFANQLLELACTSMVAHANGPNKSFNTQLTTFANNQTRIAQSEILFLQGKKAPMTEVEVASLNVTVSAQFAALVKSETALVKKK